MNAASKTQPLLGRDELYHFSNDELERAVLAMYAVENMVPLFNRLIEHGYLTGVEHVEFLQRYRLLSKHLFPRASTVENPT